jgi:deoxyribodipyrimidine photolyase-related protein
VKTGLIILGNQLFDPTLLGGQRADCVFMREDLELCTYFKFHKLKIFFFLAAMRSFAEELREFGLPLEYQELEPDSRPYEEHLRDWIEKEGLKKVICYEIEDKFFEMRIAEALESTGAQLEFLPSPMFLTGREEFKTYLSKGKRPFMKTFYESQRRRLKILVDKDEQPTGGQWSFDEMNRKPLPKNVQPPEPSRPRLSDFAIQTDLVGKLNAVCTKHFSHHPGALDNIWMPFDRKGARAWLAEFVEWRLADFGPYEDALTERSDFVFHSALTPLLNTGLLTPNGVIEAVLQEAKNKKIEIASVEGFVRQVIGWREFIRGIYQNFSEKQETTNFWGHKRKLNQRWYQASTGVPPLDAVIEKTNRLGYAHHIERLMVVGNLMLLLEVDPHEAHRWFMEMYVDSSDWVMGPNVYGMGLFSDGGIFATKPYICGSNYYRKMGGYSKGDWCDGVDGLYWSFVEKHRAFFLKNPRLSMMVRSVEKMDSGRKSLIYAAADDLREKLTVQAL